MYLSPTINVSLRISFKIRIHRALYSTDDKAIEEEPKLEAESLPKNNGDASENGLVLHCRRAVAEIED